MKKMLFNIDSSREIEIPKVLNKTNAKIGVEIGVFKAQFSKHLLSNWSGTLYMIDPWRPLGDEYIDSSNHKNHMNAYEESMKNIKGFEDRAFMLRGLGENFADLFKDQSLDFVYIDGNHAYSYVKADINMWWPKLKEGGLLLGHDYLKLDWYDPDQAFHENGIDKHMWMWSEDSENKEPAYAGIFGVNPAVDEFCEEHGLSGAVTNEFTGSFVIIKP